MFTRAGYNLRGAFRWPIWARVSVIGRQRCAWAQIVQFGSGDLAWHSPRGHFLIWGLRAHLLSRVWLQGGFHRQDMPYSDLQTRDLHWWFKR